MFSASFRQGMTTETSGSDLAAASVAVAGALVWASVLMPKVAFAL